MGGLGRSYRRRDGARLGQRHLHLARGLRQVGGDSQARSRRWPFDRRTAQQRGAGRQPVAYQLSPNERQLLRKLPFLFWLWRTHSPKSLLKEWTGQLGSKAQRIDSSARELG